MGQYVKLFSSKKRREIAFFTPNNGSLFKSAIIKCFFFRKTFFSAENWPKSAKMAIITMAPGRSGDSCNRHLVDPQLLELVDEVGVARAAHSAEVSEALLLLPALLAQLVDVAHDLAVLLLQVLCRNDCVTSVLSTVSIAEIGPVPESLANF
jgi:hypothetical protein